MKTYVDVMKSWSITRCVMSNTFRRLLDFWGHVWSARLEKILDDVSNLYGLHMQIKTVEEDIIWLASQFLSAKEAEMSSTQTCCCQHDRSTLFRSNIPRGAQQDRMQWIRAHYIFMYSLHLITFWNHRHSELQLKVQTSIGSRPELTGIQVVQQPAKWTTCGFLAYTDEAEDIQWPEVKYKIFNLWIHIKMLSLLCLLLDVKNCSLGLLNTLYENILSTRLLLNGVSCLNFKLSCKGLYLCLDLWKLAYSKNLALHQRDIFTHI